MRVHVHIPAWNEGETLLRAVRHYLRLADCVFVHDDGSDDGSIEALPRGVTVVSLGRNPTYRNATLETLRSTGWREHGGHDTWALVVDVDEIVECRTPLQELCGYLQLEGYGAARAEGYTLVERGPPVGHRDFWMDKVVLFSWSRVANARTGTHSTHAMPVDRHGRPVPIADFPDGLRLMHEKLCVPERQLEARAQALLLRQDPEDWKNGLSFHLRRLATDAREQLARARALSSPLEVYA